MELRARPLSCAFLLAAVALGAIWFDSLGRYVATRYHIDWTGDAAGDSGTSLEPSQAPIASPQEPSATSHQAAKESRFPSDADYSLSPPDMDYWPDVVKQNLSMGPQHVLFAGDSMMQGLAPLVMRELKKRYPDWTSYDLSRQNTGLTVKRYFDWPDTIVQEIKTAHLAPTVVVIFLGPNDPWDIYEPGLHLKFPSKAWANRYAQRVDVILQAAKANGVYVLWVGLPAMKDARLQTGARLQNAIFSQRASLLKTDYLTIEPLIGCACAPYQQTRFRASDGIHFSGAGLHVIKDAVLARLALARKPGALEQADSPSLIPAQTKEEPLLESDESKQ